jgi:hypothetical protein
MVPTSYRDHLTITVRRHARSATRGGDPRRSAMRGSGREARRRPELDLLVGPFEAATIDDDARSERSATEEIELVDPFEAPTWREDG